MIDAKACTDQERLAAGDLSDEQMSIFSAPPPPALTAPPTSIAALMESLLSSSPMLARGGQAGSRGKPPRSMSNPRQLTRPPKPANTLPGAAGHLDPRKSPASPLLISRARSESPGTPTWMSSAGVLDDGTCDTSNDGASSLLANVGGRSASTGLEDSALFSEASTSSSAFSTISNRNGIRRTTRRPPANVIPRIKTIPEGSSFLVRAQSKLFSRALQARRF